MSKDNSGPAYPSANNVRIGDMVTGGHSGMTLRDYFAAKAMGSIIAGCMADGLDYPNHDGTAIQAYAYADAMLAARVKP